MINKTTAIHYKWGKNCDTWNLVDKKNLSVKLETMPPGTKEKLHFHKKAQQFFFILKGEAVFYIAEKQEILKEKEGILIEPGTEHFIANESEKELEFLVVSQPTTAEDRTNIDSD